MGVNRSGSQGAAMPAAFLLVAVLSLGLPGGSATGDAPLPALPDAHVAAGPVGVDAAGSGVAVSADPTAPLSVGLDAPGLCPTCLPLQIGGTAPSPTPSTATTAPAGPL